MPASHARLTSPLLTTRRGVLLATVAVVSAPVTASLRETPPSLLHATGYYFATPDNKAVLLAGSHTWTNALDINTSASNANPANRVGNNGVAFDNPAYLQFLANGNMNFIRLWSGWESTVDGGAVYGPVSPLPYIQSGGKSDLSQINPDFINRIVSRVQAAAAARIYVSVQCFNGASVSASTAWNAHPFNVANNLQGVNGDLNGTGLGYYVHQQTSGPIWTHQTTFVAALVTALKSQPNVLWEICNESQDGGAERAWQVALCNYIKSQEQSGGGLIHPVGITAPAPAAVSAADTNSWLLSTPADWVSLSGAGGTYQSDSMPNAPGTKPVLLDTDHIYGEGGDGTWVWTSIMLGYSTLYMDDLTGTGIAGLLIASPTSNQANATSARAAMTQARHLASLVDFSGMVPSGNLSSTGYCLANMFKGEYLVLAKNGANITVNLLGASSRSLQADWLDLRTGKLSSVSAVSGTSSNRAFAAPNRAGVLIIRPGQ